MFQNFRRVIPAYHFLVPRTTQRSFSRHDGLVKVQRVRFKRPWFRRGISTILTAVVATQVYFALIGPSLDRLEDVDEHIDEDSSLQSKIHTERDRHRDNDGVPFVPIGLPYSVPGGLYTENDPEWKTFKSYALETTKFKQLRGVASSDLGEEKKVNNQHSRTHSSSSGPSDVVRSRQKYPITTETTQGEIARHGNSTDFEPPKPSSALQKEPGVPGEPASDFRNAMKIFTLFLLLTRRKNTNKTPQHGSFKMNGVVRFRGPKGGCEAHVVGIYEPTTKNWYMIEVQILHTFPYRSDAANRLPPQRAVLESNVPDS
ncbi:conserved hypothetical protein [Histoplasma capsulatum H143]|uniref:Uncharacterized protein n=1 Tax=Ajellomyces capsulatus (strain H143) TaxID=544712 RepID=C6HFY7_AJECH|nr:conserved hypothetical protein [Histoplasma capsulatum H143]